MRFFPFFFLSVITASHCAALNVLWLPNNMVPLYKYLNVAAAEQKEPMRLERGRKWSSRIWVLGGQKEKDILIEHERKQLLLKLSASLFSNCCLWSLSLAQVGEDVPDARKCACASHVATIADFFQVGLSKRNENAIILFSPPCINSVTVFSKSNFSSEAQISQFCFYYYYYLNTFIVKSIVQNPHCEDYRLYKENNLRFLSGNCCLLMPLCRMYKHHERGAR